MSRVLFCEPGSLLEAGRDTQYEPGTLPLCVRGHSIVWQPAKAGSEYGAVFVLIHADARISP